MDIKPQYIDSIAPNGAAARNGRDLARKGRLASLRASPDGTLLLGECAGSGKEAYQVSADFIRSASPAFRCTCPSHQYPCKHALGLLYACAEGQKFEPCGIPQDILDWREKAAKREERKKEPSAVKRAKGANDTALVKKIHAQIEGLDILEKVALEIASSGMGLLSRQQAWAYREQVKQLGGHYLPGAQAMLRGFLLLFEGDAPDEATQTRALAELGGLHALAVRGRAYLLKKAEDRAHTPDTTTDIEELLGNAWQLSQLRELGLVELDAELAQLSFRCHEDDAAQEFVDEGLWIKLDSGAILRTVNRRPYKAAKYIKEDDSFFLLAQAPELACYPGALNPRVRWEKMTEAKLTADHYKRIFAHAMTSYAEAVKAARNVVKDPLGGRFPAFLLGFTRIGTADGDTVMENAAGERLVLANAPEYPATVGNLYFLGRRQQENAALLGVFHREASEGALRFQPLSAIWPGGIVRLGY